MESSTKRTEKGVGAASAAPASSRARIARALPIRSSPVTTAPSLRATLSTLKTPAASARAPARAKSKSKPPYARNPVLQELEPRLLMSADLNPLSGDALLASPALAGAEFRNIADTGTPTVVTSGAVAPIQRTNELVFVDTATPDYQKLTDEMRQSALGQGRNLEFVLIDQERDGIRKITDTLAQKSDLDAIHIISHAHDGAVKLGSAQLDFDSLLKRAAAIKKWGDALTENGDLLIYGCDLAASAEGKSLVDALARLTGADVAASEDLTGAAAKGGDWDLEFRTGEIETQVAVSAGEQSAWNHVLAEPSYVGNGVLSSGTGTITPALPAGLQVGDVLLAVFESQGDQAVTINNPNGGTWTQLAAPNVDTGNNSTRLTVFYASTTARRATRRRTIRATTFPASSPRSGASTRPARSTLRARSTGNSAAVSVPAATTTVADTLVVMVGSSDDDADTFGNWANTGLTSVTERYEQGHAQGTQGTISMATGVRATAGAYAASTSTLSGSSRWAGMTIALTPRTISGTIFNDVNADSTVSAPEGVFAGATVRLYQDNGNDIPDAADGAAIQTVTTNASGQYTFTGVGTGTYWVVVDSRSLTLAAGSLANGAAGQDDIWADQTYAAANATALATGGAIRAVYYDGAAHQFDSTSGAFYGGLIGGRTDDGIDAECRRRAGRRAHPARPGDRRECDRRQLGLQLQRRHQHPWRQHRLRRDRGRAADAAGQPASVHPQRERDHRRQRHAVRAGDHTRRRDRHLFGRRQLHQRRRRRLVADRGDRGGTAADYRREYHDRRHRVRQARTASRCSIRTRGCSAPAAR